MNPETIENGENYPLPCREMGHHKNKDRGREPMEKRRRRRGVIGRNGAKTEKQNAAGRIDWAEIRRSAPDGKNGAGGLTGGKKTSAGSRMVTERQGLCHSSPALFVN